LCPSIWGYNGENSTVQWKAGGLSAEKKISKRQSP